ncbi:MAG: 4-deoxy-4-formamido-L-arabinose-phosphoundecaprenol deformylase [Proteobacteria bacterium]|nr:4-deoxy-4-formamido-L-arabinose-phosphoundecaprenol deformylase [Pseudomonadota bacterium]MBU1234559.1 4-deoxy-4-formamido-L-arabinose-phosphoundecaprenol deformylase [Pseudomonadota bacterium]MBU1417025.1 4-deoxy-4-formamido-L-arabinose-phosphoundecaprenol deformylase [Pseudomonadota bacterium]MBU1453721.1 4-deoxy-4-formamido-L-arabinose-phosphoundecaprenol deformylase [Pseudomonadota bacterium]
MQKIGLRIDVDTLRGTRLGVPELCQLLAEHGITASFFFSVGPDNMGRHLWRLLRPSFLIKMLRTNAASLYGWDILLKGTFWRGPSIAKGGAAAILQAAADGHELGVHAWDHHGWQAGVENWSTEQVEMLLQKAVDTLQHITGQSPVSAAAPAWRCTDNVLLAREKFDFSYSSDCRGSSAFVPEIGGKRLHTPQIPTTLPTYDELIGSQGVTTANYNERLLSFVRPGQLNILTIHAEVEGIVCSSLFRDFLTRAREEGYCFCPLGEFVSATAESLPSGKIVSTEIPGRDGWISIQK